MKHTFSSPKEHQAAIEAGVDAYLAAGRFVPVVGAENATSEFAVIEGGTPIFVVFRDYITWAKARKHPLATYQKSLQQRVRLVHPDWKVCRASYVGNVHEAWAVGPVAEPIEV